MQILALIPARGGSKGILRKNLRKLNGTSLVAHSVLAAKKSKLITRIIVSTDSEEIKNESLKAGAEVPFLRPKKLAEDHVLDLPVFEHALNFLKEKENYQPDFVVHLRPTSPYRKGEWMDEAIQLLIKNPQADSVRSVSEPGQHPYRVFRIDNNGFLLPVMQHEHPTPYLLRRQDLPKMYFYNCVIDVTRPKTILEKKSMTGDKMLPYIMQPEDVIDIDSPQDLQIAEIILKDKKIIS